jgi:uncharacterized protein
MAKTNDSRTQTKPFQPLPAALAGLAFGLIAAGGAAAQSFDGAAAKTRVELTICGDKKLGDQDAALDALYRSTRDSAAAPEAVVVDQRAWLKTRNACADAACLSAAYAARTAALGRVPSAGWTTYRNATLGISFDYLANRSVGPCVNEPGPKCVALFGHEAGRKKELLEITVSDSALDKVAQDSGIFDLQDGKWMAVAGPGAPAEADHFQGKGWMGIRATITCGVSDKDTGFHAGGGECFWAVLSNGRRAVVADSDGTTSNDAATAKSVQSIRFQP